MREPLRTRADASVNVVQTKTEISSAFTPSPVSSESPEMNSVLGFVILNQRYPPATALGWDYVGQNIYSFSLSALLGESFPAQPLQQVRTANEDNFERWLDAIPLYS
ncbi:unnamed protein product [Pleuronectes platessa]|uniref:Uncharacterized protein n=1 Tax=Pleuronectes platessa TaxID=8262 RepID=A0A9N7Y9Y9_PLEPL|nr:unnamed protein product [Pleuronectes platessa]